MSSIEELFLRTGPQKLEKQIISVVVVEQNFNMMGKKKSLKGNKT